MVGRGDMDLDQLDAHTYFCKVTYTYLSLGCRALSSTSVA